MSAVFKTIQGIGLRDYIGNLTYHKTTPTYQ